MKVVVDTSVWLSMLLAPRGAGAWLVAMWQGGKFAVITSPALYEELVEVTERPRLASKIDALRRLALLRRLHQEAVWTPGILDASGELPDPGDDLVASAALESQADFIVTWDKALLEHKICRGIPLISPDQFLSLIAKGE